MTKTKKYVTPSDYQYYKEGCGERKNSSLQKPVIKCGKIILFRKLRFCIINAIIDTGKSLVVLKDAEQFVKNRWVVRPCKSFKLSPHGLLVNYKNKEIYTYNTDIVNCKLNKSLNLISSKKDQRKNMCFLICNHKSTTSTNCNIFTEVFKLNLIMKVQS